MAGREVDPGIHSRWIEAGRNFESYMAMAKFGSPRLLAFSDKVHQISLWSDLSFLLSSIDEGDKKASKLRVTEFEIALLNRQVYNRKVEIPGYAVDFSKIEDYLNELDFASLNDIRDDNNYPTEEAKRAIADEATNDFIWGLYNSLTLGQGK